MCISGGWQREVFPSAARYSGGLLGMPLPEKTPDEPYQVVIGEWAEDSAVFSVQLNDTDLEAWAAHWEKETFRREQERRAVIEDANRTQVARRARFLSR